jgi:hypothetical protein
MIKLRCLGYNTVQSGRYVPRFRRNLRTTSSPTVQNDSIASKYQKEIIRRACGKKYVYNVNAIPNVRHVIGK